MASSFPKLLLGLGTGRFGRVSACSTTRPVTLGFEQIQPAMNSKIIISVGYSGRTGQCFAGGLGIFLKIKYLTKKSHTHASLHSLPANQIFFFSQQNLQYGKHRAETYREMAPTRAPTPSLSIYPWKPKISTLQSLPIYPWKPPSESWNQSDGHGQAAGAGPNPLQNPHREGPRHEGAAVPCFAAYRDSRD
jgi:hypothetical protein